jgi:hypothetical protein
MGQRSMKVSEDKEFITSDRWKCEKSESGAHFWIIQSYEMTCKYCHNTKQVNTNRFGWTKPDEK